MTKNKWYRAAAVLAAAGLLTAGGAFAFFTDQADVLNTVTIGSVKVEVTEPSWPGNDEVTDVYPGEVIPKDPTITNTGKNPAYVRMEILVPVGDVKVYDEEEGSKLVKDAELITYQTNEGWTENTSLMQLLKVNEINYQRHIYTYDSILEPEQKTTPLFDQIQLINLIEDQIPEGTLEKILINAMAIQSQGMESAAQAWQSYDKQNQ